MHLSLGCYQFLKWNFIVSRIVRVGRGDESHREPSSIDPLRLYRTYKSTLFTPAVASLLAVCLGCQEEGLGKRVTTGLSLNANFAY
ncbi:hypothetical protein EMIT051CA3_20152 [Pseudomonas chlororaphis]